MSYDLDLQCTLGGWAGTFRRVIAAAVADLTIEGPLADVEVTYDDGKIARGMLQGLGGGDDTIVIDGLLIEIERVERVRA